MYAALPKGRVRRGAGDRKAGKALNPVRREVERREHGPVPGLWGDGDPVAGATVHSPTGSWDIGRRMDKGFGGGESFGDRGEHSGPGNHSFLPHTGSMYSCPVSAGHQVSWRHLPPDPAGFMSGTTDNGMNCADKGGFLAGSGRGIEAAGSRIGTRTQPFPVCSGPRC